VNSWTTLEVIEIKQEQRDRPTCETGSADHPFGYLGKVAAVCDPRQRINQRGAPVEDGNPIFSETSE